MSRQSWFESLFGFKEPRDGEALREQLQCGNGILRSKVNGARYKVGTLRTPSLSELREQGQAALKAAPKSSILKRKKLRAKHSFGDVSLLQASYNGAAFMVASQFNCLEFVSPQVCFQ